MIEAKTQKGVASPDGRDGVYEVPAIVWFASPAQMVVSTITTTWLLDGTRRLSCKHILLDIARRNALIRLASGP